jgi:hypothetical protein
MKCKGMVSQNSHLQVEHWKQDNTTTRCSIKASLHFFAISTILFLSFQFVKSNSNSSVGIVTRYGLDGPGIESRRGETFCTRPNRPWGPPIPLYKGYRVSFPWVKRSAHGVYHPPPSNAEVKERVELYLCSLCEPSWLTLPLFYIVKTNISRHL